RHRDADPGLYGCARRPLFRYRRREVQRPALHILEKRAPRRWRSVGRLRPLLQLLGPRAPLGLREAHGFEEQLRQETHGVLDRGDFLISFSLSRAPRGISGGAATT